MNWTEEQLAELIMRRGASVKIAPALGGRQRPHKYGAKPTTVDGHFFPSTAEANRYGELCLMQKAGVISELELQPRYPFPFGVEYRADFRYMDKAKGKYIAEDVKGISTPVFKLKLKAFHYYFSRATLLINGVGSKEWIAK